MYTPDVHTEQNKPTISFLDSHTSALVSFNVLLLHFSFQLPDTTVLINMVYIACTLFIFRNYVYAVGRLKEAHTIEKHMSIVQ